MPAACWSRCCCSRGKADRPAEIEHELRRRTPPGNHALQQVGSDDAHGSCYFSLTGGMPQLICACGSAACSSRAPFSVMPEFCRLMCRLGESGNWANDLTLVSVTDLHSER